MVRYKIEIIQERIKNNKGVERTTKEQKKN